MAEVLATMVVGPLVSMVKDKASSYLLEQYSVMEGMEEQHKLLKRRLPAILDVIADAEMQAAEHREGAKAWLEEVRDVSYKANDVLDEFKYEALRRKAKKEGHYRRLGMHFIKLFPTHNRIVFRYRMGNKLRMILQETEVLIDEMNAFRFKFRPQPQLSMKWRQTDSKIDDPIKEIASRSRVQDKQKVVDTVLGQGNNENLTVLPIVGMGGLGKTTLAQLVYNDSKIQEHFQLLLWVCVSDNFDVDFLAKSIVEAAQVKENKNGSISSERSLDNLREVVSGKRYLLVLDDVWNRDANQWGKLKSCLQHGSTGSSVVTTTRDEEIAKLMGTTEAYKLDLLDKSFIEEIIKIKAFGSKYVSSTDDERVGMVGDMAKKCHGSPLAATALGSLLCTKASTDEWKVVLSRSTICDKETGILPILKLSYNELPPQMRQCFSFCALFPKDYEINIEVLIQLWIANGFILEDHEESLEIRGKQIFNELASRSFFQEVKEIPFDLGSSKIFLLTETESQEPRYSSRITCKIHDLMHDVALSAMGKECVAIERRQIKTEDLPYSTRHLFVSGYDPEIILNGFKKERCPALQTLICTGVLHKELGFLSRYNSIRALRILGDLSLKPKYLHHLRYFDLSGTDFEALPEGISILYHLQTLNLSNCRKLTQLPKDMKYMTTLRHIYIDGCWRLKMMPPELRCLTSLQTLTYFVVGTSSTCSDLGELGSLDLGGHLEICNLENVAEEDARAANLENKKNLIALRLRWTDPTIMEPKPNHQKVLEALKPHKGIKALGIYSYGGNTCPTWINNLRHIVVLDIDGCYGLQKLPSLWQLQNLQVLHVSRMENLLCFCGDPRFGFNKLKEIELFGMPNFQAWCDIDEVQGQGLIFPVLEKLSVRTCGKLTALPKASLITDSSGGVNISYWSAFPALKELELSLLTAFQRWEAADGTAGEQITTFPSLENLRVGDCPELTTLPEAPKLKDLMISGASQQIWLHVARYITLLSTLELSLDEPTHHCLIKLSDDKEKYWSRESALRNCQIRGCDFLLMDSNAPALWNCLVQLEDLQINNCNSLVHWPEDVFRCLVSLRKLKVHFWNNLTGCTKASERATSGHSVLPPRLEFLYVWECNALVEVPILPASLTHLFILACDRLESMIVRKQQQQTTAGLGSRDCSLTMQGKSALIGWSRTKAVPNDSLGISERYGVAEVPDNLSPSMAYIEFGGCSNLRSLLVKVDCTRFVIFKCTGLESLDDLPPLEGLQILECDSLASMPDVPEAYNSLRELDISGCPCLKVLPSCLQQRLNDIEYTDVDDCYTGSPGPKPKLSKPSTWKYAISRHC